MWSSYVKPVIWSSWAPCSTYFSTSEVVGSVSTSYTTIPVTSFSWTTGTSYTTISTTVTETSLTTRTTDETSWTTATTLTTEPIVTTEHYSVIQTFETTKPISTTQYFETTATILTTHPVLTHETEHTVVTDHSTLIDFDTIYTTESRLLTYLTSHTAYTTLTSSMTFETTETRTASQSVETIASVSIVSTSAPPLPPPAPVSSSPLSPATTSSGQSVASPAPAPPTPTTTPPPPPPPPNPCDQPPIEEFFGVTWIKWRPIPGAEPIATVYRTVDPILNVTSTSTFCDTRVFEKYYRTNLYDCAQGCGPYQTLNDECSIVIGPVFTGTTCGGKGYTITQHGSSNNVINFGTSIVGSGLTSDSTCISVTTTTLATPLIYTGDVQPIDNLATARLRRRDPITDPLVEAQQARPGIFNQPAAQRLNGVQITLGGAEATTPPAITARLTKTSSNLGTAEPVVNPTIRTSTPPSSSAQATAEPLPVDTSATDASSTENVITSQAPPSATEDQSLPQTPTQESAPTVGSPPIRPTSSDAGYATTSPMGSMSTGPFSGVELTATTCVPLSMVIPSYLTSSASEPLTISSTASFSVPQQIGSSAASLGSSVDLGWVFALAALPAIL